MILYYRIMAVKTVEYFFAEIILKISICILLFLLFKLYNSTN